MPAPPSSPEQAGRLLAADPNVSAWVAANAGTGKTTVLVNRMTRLLLQGTPPERILCLTFTKAAAAEMADRLAHRLGRWAVAGDDELRREMLQLTGREAEGDGEIDITAARRLFARSLEVPGGLKIQTIHAFCESLLARFPLEAGLSPHFAVADDRRAEELLREARDRMLFAGDDGIALALEHLAALVSEDDFDKLMRELQVGRGRLSRMIAGHGGMEGLLAAVWRALGLGEGETRESVAAAAGDSSRFDEAGLMRLAAALSRGNDNDIKRAGRILNWLEADVTGRAAVLADYLDVFLTQKGEARKTVITKKAVEADPGAVTIVEAEQLRLEQVACKLKAVGVAESTRSLLRVGAALLESFTAAKRSRALLDYDDLILRARDLLRSAGGISWVLYKLDGGIDHILVDEAQDTSPEQWEIIAAVANEFFAGQGAGPGHRTLFVVGDEKQSIYSFQGADPEGFARMRAHFESKARESEETFKSVEIERSFRSTWTILQAVDKIFAQGEAADGLSSAGRPVIHHSTRDGQAGLVELWPALKPMDEGESDPWDAPLDHLSAASPESRMAERIAATISGWLEGGEILQSADRPIRPGDVMILVRKRGAFMERMVRALKQRNVPVAGADRMVLTDQLPVMDLMALGRFALLPDDDLNLAVVLKGPLVGLDDDALFRLAWRRESSLWRAVREDAGLKVIGDFLAVLLAAADYAPPYEFFARILGAMEGRRKILARLGREAADAIDEFLALALNFEKDHRPSLQGFLHWLESGKAEIKRDMEQGRDQVRVMTVHGAKGLQAEVVFLPDTCSVPSARNEPKLRWRLGEGDPVVLWPVASGLEDALSLEIKDQARQRALREYRRLFYVAMTRARDRLYIGGFEGKRGRGEGCWYDLAAAALARDELLVAMPDGSEVWRMAAPQTAPPEPETAPVEEKTRKTMPEWVRRPPPPEPEPPRPLAPSRPDDAPPPSGPLAGGDAIRFRRGRLIHRLLQSLPDLSPEKRFKAALAFLDQRADDLAEEERLAMAGEVMAVLEHPQFAPLFGPRSRAEVPMVGLVEGQALSAQVDRLAVLEDCVMVVDYKTNRQPPADPSLVPKAYVRQMEAYRKALSAIYADRPVRCFLLWTDGPKLMELP